VFFIWLKKGIRREKVPGFSIHIIRLYISRNDKGGIHTLKQYNIYNVDNNLENNIDNYISHYKCFMFQSFLSLSKLFSHFLNCALAI